MFYLFYKCIFLTLAATAGEITLTLLTRGNCTRPGHTEREKERERERERKREREREEERNNEE